MKYTKVLFTLFLTLPFITLSCKNTITEIDEEIVIEGFVYDLFLGDTLFNKNVRLTVNGESYETNEYGYFKIEDIEPGEYLFSLNSELHLATDTTIAISESLSKKIMIRMNQRMLDFFPLGDNIQWEYHSHSNSVTFGSNSISSESFSTITTTSSFIDENDSFYIYEFESINEGYTVQSNTEGSEQMFDTTQTYIKSNYQIYEDKVTSEIDIELLNSELPLENVIHAGGPFYHNSGDSFVFILRGGKEGKNDDYYYDNKFKRRYAPHSRMLVNKQLHIEGNYVVKADTGLVFHNYSYGGHTGSGAWGRKLINFTRD